MKKITLLILLFIATNGQAQATRFLVFGKEYSLPLSTPLPPVVESCDIGGLTYTLDSLSGELSEFNYDNFLTELDKITQKVGGGDFGKMYVLDQFFEKYFSSHINQNTKAFYSWFFLHLQYYHISLYSVNCQLYPMGGSDILIYSPGKPDEEWGTRYIFCDTCEEICSSCIELELKNRTSNNNHLKNFKLYDLSKINVLKKDVSICFEYKNKAYIFNGIANQHLISFYNFLPPFSYDKIYLDFAMSSEMRIRLTSFFKQSTVGFTNEEKVNFVLTFVQQGIYYPYSATFTSCRFPEETLYDKEGVCFDKTILAYYILKEIFSLDAVVLIYKEEHHTNIGISEYSVKITPDMFYYTINGIKYAVGETTSHPGTSILGDKIDLDLNFTPQIIRY